jgi:hypothetical protein
MLWRSAFSLSFLLFGALSAQPLPSPGFEKSPNSFARLPMSSKPTRSAGTKYTSAEKPDWAKDADLLPVFAKPNPESAFAEIKVLQPDGSVYRTPKEDWEGARQRITSDSQWREWFAQQRAEIDDWMTTHHDRVEWQAGWWHNFVSPKDGSFLTWTPAIPGEQTNFLSSPSDPRVELTPEIIGGWVYGFRSRHVAKIQEAARLYRITEDVHYANWAGEQLDFYAENYERWPLQSPLGTPVRIGYQSLDEAVNLTKFTDAARLLFEWAGENRRQLWYRKFLKPQSELLDRSFQVVHNIATWQRAASAQVALLYNDTDMWSRVVDGEYGLRAQLRRGVTSDYLWYEQSMGYNGYVLYAVQPLLTFAGLVGKKDMLREEAAIIQNLPLAPLALRFPDGTLPNPADAGAPGHVSSSLLEGIRRILPTTLGVAAAAKPGKHSWDNLLDPPEPLADLASDLPPVVSHHFETTRFALLKNGPWQVFFHYGQVNSSHAQAEALNWSASFSGVNVTHDPGTVGYGSPLSKDYYRRGLNHNVPLVNGEGQQSWQPGEPLMFDPTPGHVIMAAAQPRYRSNASARRTLRIDGDRLIDEATVFSTQPRGARLGLALHLQGVPRLPASFLPDASFVKSRPKAFTYWNDVRSASFTDEAEILVDFPEGKTLRVRITTSGPFVLYTGSSPDFPPKRRAGFYIEKKGTHKEGVFITEIAPIY